MRREAYIGTHFVLLTYQVRSNKEYKSEKKPGEFTNKKYSQQGKQAGMHGEGKKKLRRTGANSACALAIDNKRIGGVVCVGETDRRERFGPVKEYGGG